MTRIASLAANNQLVALLLNTQARVHAAEVQVATEKKSQTYAGIAGDSERLVNLENARDALSRFVDTNDIMETRMSAASTTIEAIRETLRDFRNQLSTFHSFETQDQQRVQDIQDAAFRTLKVFEGFLNTKGDGRFLFSGSRVNTQPVDFNLSTLANLQASFDGATVTVPTTRDAQLAEFSLARDTVTTQGNFLTFQRDDGSGAGRITATSNGVFTNLKAGTTFTVTGTASNNGTYTIQSVDATNGRFFNIVTEMLTDENNVQATITRLDNVNLNPFDTGDLTFARATDTITAATAGSLASIPVGQAFTVTGSASNNGTYTVVSNDGTNIVVKAKKLTDEGGAGTETLNFTSAGAEVSFVDNVPASDTIVANAGRFSNLTAGMRVTVAGATDAGNNTTFTVASVSADGSTITVTGNVTARANDPATVSFLTTEAGGTLAAAPYYRGDLVNPTHRVSATQDFAYDITAADPAFEKAIRAIFLIAQGTFKSEGGLDQNPSRVGNALFLLDSALDAPSATTPPFGTELTSNINQMQMDLGFDQVLLSETNKQHKNLIAFMESRMSETENIDELETITRLLDDSRVFEASLQTLARIRQISLTNFLSADPCHGHGGTRDCAPAEDDGRAGTEHGAIHHRRHANATGRNGPHFRGRHIRPPQDPSGIRRLLPCLFSHRFRRRAHRPLVPCHGRRRPGPAGALFAAR
jgi:hypothetical protein